MGQPAARMGDTTSHGGVVAVGFPRYAYLPYGHSRDPAGTTCGGANYKRKRNCTDRWSAGSAGG
jgi:hypothetical protein